MKSSLRFVKILMGAVLIFSVLLFLPIVLGVGLLATLGASSWVLSKMIHEDPDD